MDKDLTLEDVEEKETEVEKKLSDKAANAIKGALKMLNAYKDEFKGKVADAVNALAEAAGYGEGEYAKPEKEAKVEKAGAKFSKEDKAKVRAIAKEILSLIEEEIEEVAEIKEVKKADKPEVDTAEIAKYVEKKINELLKD